MHQTFISSKGFERLKTKAKQLKKLENIKHHEALEKVARSAGFKHWHQASLSHKQSAITEDAFNHEAVIIFDTMEGLEFDARISSDSKSPFKQDDCLYFLCRDALWETFLNEPDEDDPELKPYKLTCSEEDNLQFFLEHYESLIFFRLKSSSPSMQLGDVKSLIDKYTFWSPLYIFYRGELCAPIEQVAKDSKGNIVGVTF